MPSAGGAIFANGKTSGGAGGDITLIASYTIGTGSGNHGDLVIDGGIASYGFTRGGRLTLETGGEVVIGDGALGFGDTLAAGTPAPLNLTLTSSTVIPAGAPLPIGWSQSRTSLPSGTVVDPSLYSQFASGVIDPNIGYVRTAAAWTNIPTTMFYRNDLGSTFQVSVGGTVPAGVFISSLWLPSVGDAPRSDILPGGVLVFPTDVFPTGVPLRTPVVTNYAVGDRAPVDVTLAAGDNHPEGLRAGAERVGQAGIGTGLAA